MTVPALAVQIQGQGTVSDDNMNTWLQSGAVASQLRVLTGLPNMCVMLSGITTPNDGGGGFFYWNEFGNQPDDNFTYITPNGTFTGQWTRLGLSIPQGVLNFNSDVIIGGYLSKSYLGSQTALTGGQAGAYAITAQITTFTTVPVGGGCILPLLNKSGVFMPPGTEIKVLNRGANVLSVYPPFGYAMETLAVNAPVGIPTGGNATYISTGGSLWRVT